MIQAKKLQKDFGVNVDWRGYELFPEDLEFPESTPSAPVNPDKPKTPNRMDLMLIAEGLTYPTNKFSGRIRTHNAHEAVEFCKTIGKADAMVEALYNAYWNEANDINDMLNLTNIVKSVIGDPTECMQAVAQKAFASEIVGFDDPAYAKGVYNVPTFWIDGERYAEQPYTVLSSAVQALTMTAV